MKRSDKFQRRMSWQCWTIAVTTVAFILPHVGLVIETKKAASFFNNRDEPASSVKLLAVGDEKPLYAQKPVYPKRLAILAVQLKGKYQESTAALTELSESLPAYRRAKVDLTPIIEPLFDNSGWGGISRRQSWTAESMIVWIGRPAIPLLHRRLKSDETHDRRVATELLVRIGPQDESLVTLLRPLLNDRDDSVRRATINGLGEIGTPAKAAISNLEQLAADDPILILRIEALSALLRVAGVSNKRIQDLAAFLTLEEDEDVRGACGYAASELGRFGIKARVAEPMLLSTLKHSHAQVRINVASSLGKVGANSPETIAALIDLLESDPSREVRRSAAASLGAIGPQAKAAVPALRKTLTGDPQGGWFVAIETLCKIGSPDLVTILTEALTNPDDEIRHASVKGLGNLGTQAKPAMMALEQICKQDSCERIRTSAAEALRKIEQAIMQMK